MKAKRIPDPPPVNVFKPVTIQLTFETQKELDAVTSICNSGLIRGTIHRVTGNSEFLLDVWKVLHAAGGSSFYTGAIEQDILK